MERLHGHRRTPSRWRSCSSTPTALYRKSHPWVGDHPLSPKSVIRDMYERAMTFTEFVSFYELARTEGIVLRYLASAYKALDHTVPDDLKSEDFQDIDRLARRDGASGRLQPARRVGAAGQPRGGDAPRRPRSGRPGQAGHRQRARLPCPGAQRDVPPGGARRPRQGRELGEMDAESGWDEDAWGEAMDAYWDEYDDLGTGPDARGPKLLQIEEDAAARRCGGSGRPSPTRTAIMTGASARRSISRPPTRRAVPSSRSPTSASCEPYAGRDRGAPPMTNPAEQLVDLLDLEQIEVNIFRGRSPQEIPAAGLRRPGRRARRWSPPGRTTDGRASGALAARVLPAARDARACRSCTRSSGCGTGGRSPPAASPPCSRAARSSI